MSQRRQAAKASATDGIKTTVVVAGVSATTAHPHEVRSPLSLDSILSHNKNDEDDNHENGNDMNGNPDDQHLLAGIGNDEIVPLAEHDPERPKIERYNACVKKWKESPFACGLTEVTWRDEQTRHCHHNHNNHNRTLPPDETGCLSCSAYVCAWLGAGRVGNMAVLKQSLEWVDEVVVDEETGQIDSRRYSRPRLDIVVGPYWPMLVFVTYGIIFTVSIWTFHTGIWGRGKPPVLIFVWFDCTVGLIVALALTACRDPGILYRLREEPPNDTWRWSDPADSYRPRNAWFDTDTAVIVEGFDHTYVLLQRPIYDRIPMAIVVTNSSPHHCGLRNLFADVRGLEQP